MKGRKLVAAAGVLDCSYVVALDAAGRLLLGESMGTGASAGKLARTHFKNRCYQPSDCLESPKKAGLAHLGTLIGDQRLVEGWRISFDMGSRGLERTSVFAIDLSTDRVLCALLQDEVKLGRVAKDVQDFIMRKQGLTVPMRMPCELLTGTKKNPLRADPERRSQR